MMRREGHGRFVVTGVAGRRGRDDIRFTCVVDGERLQRLTSNDSDDAGSGGGGAAATLARAAWRADPVGDVGDAEIVCPGRSDAAGDLSRPQAHRLHLGHDAAARVENAAENFDTSPKTIRPRSWRHAPHRQARALSVIEERGGN